MGTLVSERWKVLTYWSRTPPKINVKKITNPVKIKRLKLSNGKDAIEPFVNKKPRKAYRKKWLSK